MRDCSIGLAELEMEKLMKYPGMIVKLIFLLSLLQVGLAQNVKVHTPGVVTAWEGSPAQIPCRYSYPLHLANQLRVGIWFYQKGLKTWSVAFHSKNHSNEVPQFRHRTQLSGDLKDGDCSLTINNITQEDAGLYYCRIKFDNENIYSYFTVTRLHISDDRGESPNVILILGIRVGIFIVAVVLTVAGVCVYERQIVTQS